MGVKSPRPIYLFITVTHSIAFSVVKQSLSAQTPRDAIVRRLSPKNSFFEFTGNAALSSAKASEDGKGVIFRFYEAEGVNADIKLKLYKNIKKAALCDNIENELENIAFKDNTVSVKCAKNSVITFKIEF